jgi:membrane protease YdiL (CAAX protease family)
MNKFAAAGSPASLIPEDPDLLGRIGAVAETVILITAGSLGARALAGGLGLPTRASRDAALFAGGGPDWTMAAGAEASWLILRFGITLAAAYLISLWVGGPSRRLAGLALGGRSLAGLVGFGLVMGLLINAPVLAIDLAQRAFGLGANTPLWDLMQSHPWTPAFWLYMAVGSFGLVPVVEELFFHSYTLGRYRMHFTPGAAILAGSALFWVSHGQYLKLDPFLLVHSALTFAGAAIMAWSLIRTGSIIPALVAHVTFNIPLPPVLMAASLAAGLVLMAVFWRPIRESAIDLGRTLAATREWAFLAGTVVVLLGGATLIRAYRTAIPYLLAICLMAAIAGLIRRSPFRRRKENNAKLD